MAKKPPHTPEAPVVTRYWSDHDESVATHGKGRWKLRDLIPLLKDEPVFDLPIAFIPVCKHSFDCGDLMEFARHMKHTLEADLTSPLIMDKLGCIIDGRHRIAKALLDGVQSLPCVRIPSHFEPTMQDP